MGFYFSLWEGFMKANVHKPVSIYEIWLLVFQHELMNIFFCIKGESVKLPICWMTPQPEHYMLTLMAESDMNNML